MQNIFKKKISYVWSGKPIRDFIFVEDAADAIVKLLNSKFTGVINLATGKSHNVKKVIDIISKYSNKEIRELDKKVTGPYKLFANVNLLKKIIKWRPKYTIKSGLIKTINLAKKLN